MERDHPTQLRVWRHDGTSVVMRNPTVASDSLFSRADTIVNAPRLSGVPLREINYVEARRGEAAGTMVLLVVLIPFALAVAVAAGRE